MDEDCGLCQVSILTITWRDCEKPREISVKVIEVTAEIRRAQILNINQNHYGSISLLAKFILI